MGTQNDNKLLRQQLHEERRKEDEGILHTMRYSGACGDSKAKSLLTSLLTNLLTGGCILHMPYRGFVVFESLGRDSTKQRKASALQQKIAR